MSELDDSARNFLQRWSQRKRAAEKRAPDIADLSQNDKEGDSNTAAQGDADPPAFDLTTLPPIESITATSDVRAFLAPGVPEEFTRAALRRVWVADPAIRNFIGIAENQWDFTKPDSIPGFGSLKVTPELLRMVASLIGDATAQADHRQADAEQVERISEISGRLLSPTKARAGVVRSIAQDSSQGTDNDTSVQKGISDTGEKSRSTYRKHGSAVPK
jgi:Protein of unknown function (DUF3306)